ARLMNSMATRSVPSLRTMRARTLKEARTSVIFKSKETSWPTSASSDGCSNMPLWLMFMLRKGNCRSPHLQLTSVMRGHRLACVQHQDCMAQAGGQRHHDSHAHRFIVDNHDFPRHIVDLGVVLPWKSFKEDALK